MTSPSDLARKCVLQGFIPEYLEQGASQAIAEAYAAKGEMEVERKISNRMARSPIRSIAVLRAILAELPDKPREEKRADGPIAGPPPKTVDEEIAEEEEGWQSILEWFAEMAKCYGKEPRKPYEPNDPRLFEKPSILDMATYANATEEVRQKYIDNTYSSVRREAKAAKTSMHEICRRKGLVYEALLI